MILNSWVSRLFPQKVGQASPVVPTDCNDQKEFPPKCTNLAPGRLLLRLGLLAAISMEDSITNVDIIQYQSNKK